MSHPRLTTPHHHALLWFVAPLLLHWGPTLCSGKEDKEPQLPLPPISESAVKADGVANSGPQPPQRQQKHHHQQHQQQQQQRQASTSSSSPSYSKSQPPGPSVVGRTGSNQPRPHREGRGNRCTCVRKRPRAIVMLVGQYPARIYSNAPPGVPVVRVTAYDNATGFLTNFRLENKADASMFKIGKDGYIRTAETIQYEVGRTFEFFVYALYDQKADYKHIRIIVSERNLYSPRFTNATYYFPVYRYGVGDVFGNVSAIDEDVQSYNSKFNIYAEGDQAALNYVDVGRTGLIKLVRRIPESIDMFILKVTATDLGSPPKSGFAEVTIDVVMVKHPDKFCLSTTETTSTLCWKNPMPDRDFNGYIVTVRGDISRTDTIPLLTGHVEACYKLNGTQNGKQYVFSVKVDTPVFWPGKSMDLVHSKTAIGATDSCVSERFSTCSYRNPCENGGTCVPGGFSDAAELIDGVITSLDYSCLCHDGWSGSNCTTTDSCGTNPCGDFGSCVQVGADKYQCQCHDGYFGAKCQHFNFCLKAPCLHQGTCSIHQDGNYTCQCLSNYSGHNCENPDPCSPDPCRKDRGQCVIVSENLKQCVCHHGFYGEFCEREDMCETKQPCQNDGQCIRTEEGYICECPASKIGENCEANDPCIIGPCQNGGTCRVATATAGYMDYHCDCQTGNYGPECQYQRATSCQGVNCNNGTCVVTDDFQTNKCECNSGYFGQFCENFDICLAMNESCSGNGRCFSRSPDNSRYKTQYRCQCQPQYFGDECENTDYCYPKICKNGGQCTEANPGQYDCLCPNGQYLELCPGTDACIPNRCQHGGECYPDGATDYTCSCTGDWIGKNCQAENPCSTNNSPCRNGSECTVVMLDQQNNSGFQRLGADCNCPSDRIGKYCQLNNPCRNSPCLHGSCVLADHVKEVATEEIAIDYTALFHCQCTKGYTGDRCRLKSCEDVICQNNGKCESGVCLCPPEFNGPRCEIQVVECLEGQTLPDPKCYCDAGHIKCRENDCAPGEIEMFPKSGAKFCINDTTFHADSTNSANASALSDSNTIIRCCHKICEIYSPVCKTRTHCSPNGHPDTTCQYFNARCRALQDGCDKYEEENMSCLDLKSKGDRSWIECANLELLRMRDELNDPTKLTSTQVAGYADAVVGQIGAALENTTIAGIALGLITSLSNVNVSVSIEAERQNGTSKKLREFLDDYTANVSLDNGNVTMATTGLVVQAATMEAFQGDIEFEPTFINGSKTKMSISLPKNVLGSKEYNISKESRLQFISYTKSQLFTPNDNDTDTDNDVIGKQSVISASVTGVVLQNLSEPVRIVLPAIDKGVNHTCVFWDEENSTWSDRGVRTEYDTATGTFTCLSDHLTSFAVIMSPNPEALRSEIGLTYITYIGCGISMGCLFLTILTYGLFRCLYGEKSGKILLHLCTSLLLLNVAFLASSVDVSDYSDEVCTGIAILLHYFVLSSLWWMLVEAIEMYRAIVTVFTKYERFYMLKRCLVGWGIPLAIVAATASVDINYYGMNTVDEDGHEDTKICFMTPGGDNIAYYTSLLAPACLIVLVNTIVFVLVARVILRPRFQQQITSNTAPITPAQVRGAFTVMFLLGVTWIFGPLAIGEAAIVFSYLFCISNSLQGFLIFVFRCLFNPEARLAWIQLFKTGTLKRRRGPIKSKYVDSSSSKEGQDNSTTRRLSNSANMNLTTSTNYTSGHNSSMKLPLFRGTSGGIHAHPHQLHTTNGWHPNLNGMKRDKGYTNGNECGVSVSVSVSSGGGGGSRGSGSASSSADGSDLMDLNSMKSSKFDQSIEKEELSLKPQEETTTPTAPVINNYEKPPLPDSSIGYSDEFTHL